jgi:Domain of unknown function (DUF4912)
LGSAAAGVLTTGGGHATKGSAHAGATMTRDDLEQLDTKALRALARRRFAAQSRSLRSRASLLAALTRTLAPQPPPNPLPPPPKQGRARGKTTGATVGQSPTSAAPPAASLARLEPLPTDVGPGADAPVEEGFFLPHKAQRPAARRQAKAEAAAAAPLPAPAAGPPLPAGDEVPHLLARDATTLFLFWDFRRDLERGAAFGLNSPRVLFRLYDGEALVRTVEAPLGRRSLYLEGLEPGHLYSVEAWLAGSDGHARPTGRRSAPIRLAPAAPSPELQVRMVRVGWQEPLPAAGQAEEEAASPGGETLAPPARVELPASLDWRGGPLPGAPGSGRP